MLASPRAIGGRLDDLDWSRHLRPSLTTIHVPTDET
jgi:DNA-binding LacI/PurR family transcriptional regulator